MIEELRNVLASLLAIFMIYSTWLDIQEKKDRKKKKRPSRRKRKRY